MLDQLREGRLGCWISFGKGGWGAGPSSGWGYWISFGEGAGCRTEFGEALVLSGFARGAFSARRGDGVADGGGDVMGDMGGPVGVLGPAASVCHPHTSQAERVGAGDVGVR